MQNADPDAINSSGSGRIWSMKGVKTKLTGVEHEYYIEPLEADRSDPH